MCLYLGTEDRLSEAVGYRLILEAQSSAHIQCLRKNGYGYLKSNIRSWCELARTYPVVLITDLDTIDCPVSLIDDWFRHDSAPNGLCFRVAVREVESWLLADHDFIISLMGERAHSNLPENADELTNPKQYLINLADRFAPRDVREDLVPARGAIASQGTGYNSRLISFLHNWNIDRAIHRSESLRRARQAIKDLL